MTIDLQQPPVPRVSSEPAGLWQWLLRQLGSGPYVLNVSAWPYLPYRSSRALQTGLRESGDRRL